MRPLTIAYVTVDDANDRRSWSGIHYHLAQELRAQGHQLILVGPLRPQPALFVCQAFNQVTLKLTGKRFHYRDSFLLSKAYARVLERRLDGCKADLIIAPAGLAVIALLRTSIPIIHFNDRSVAGALEYHTILSDLLGWSREQSLELERRALSNAALTIYTSDWAADAARRALPAASDRIHVIPMGANLERVPDPPAPRMFPPERIKLLMIGVDWKNKGGPIAFETLQELERRGYPAQLVVCGCEVPKEFQDVDLVREGFLSKNVPEQRARLEEHLRTADFFILPTRFEAYGISFCEAAAYGIPALGTRTGGVSTIVEDGLTGHLFNMDDGGSAYADRIVSMLKAPADWQRMRTAARKRFEEYFTWEAFVKTMLAQAEASGLLSKAR